MDTWIKHRSILQDSLLQELVDKTTPKIKHRSILQDSLLTFTMIFLYTSIKHRSILQDSLFFCEFVEFDFGLSTDQFYKIPYL